MKMSDKTYDFLKFASWLYVPITTLITTLFDIWVPEATWTDPAIKTLVAIEFFIGTLVAKSNIDYNKENSGGENDESMD